MPEQRRDDGRTQRGTELLVEIVFQCERVLPRGGVSGIQRRLGMAMLDRGDDTSRIADRPAIQEQDRQDAMPRRASGADQVVGAEHLTAVRKALVVQRPADLLV